MPRDRYDDDRDDDDRPRRPRRRDDDDREDDDRPGRSRRRYDDDPPATPKGNGMATASLVLGILSVCFGPVTGVVGGILGLIGMSKPTGKGMAITGLLLSVVFSLTWIGGAVFGYLRFNEQAKRSRTSHNYMQAGLGVYNHESAYGHMPHPYVRRPNEFLGQVPADVNDRLGWRVTLLPYIEQNNLYRQFDQNQPWNGGPNQPLSSVVVPQYADADTPTDPATRMRCFYDNGAMFDTRVSVRFIEVTDGTSNTILYAEGGEKVTWTRFQEYKFDPNGPLPTLGRPDQGDFMVVMGDGSVRRIKKTVSPSTLKALITRNGGEVVTGDW